MDVARLLAFAVAGVLTSCSRCSCSAPTWANIRAAADNPYGALVIGTDVRRVYAVAFGIGAACVGAAGALVSPILPFQPSTGLSLSVTSFNIVIIGGMGSLPGAFVGGILVSVAESLGAVFLRPRSRSSPASPLILILCSGQRASSAGARHEVGGPRRGPGATGAAGCPVLVPEDDLHPHLLLRLPRAGVEPGGRLRGPALGRPRRLRGDRRHSAVLWPTWGVTPWLGMFAGAALAALLGALVAILGFRFGSAASTSCCSRWPSRRSAGSPCRTSSAGRRPRSLHHLHGRPRHFQFQDNRAYYYIALALMLLATGLVRWLERRRFGIYLTAVREDESAAEALGVDGSATSSAP